MFLGLSTYSFPWCVKMQDTLLFSYTHMLDMTAGYHINYFQFGDNYPLHHFKDKELSVIQNNAEARDIHLQVGTRKLDFGHVKRYLHIAEILKSPFLRIVIDDINYRPAETDAVKIIKQLLPLLKDKGIVLAIENHDRFKAQTLARMIENTAPGPVGVCLDSANSLGAGEGINEILPLLLPYAVNLHVKDFTVRRKDHKMGFVISGAPAGEGILDIPRLLSECSKSNRCTTATFELWMEKEETVEDTVKKEMDWADRSIKYLKNLIIK